MKELASPTIEVGRVSVSSTFCSARMGVPAATRPTSGSEMRLRSTSWETLACGAWSSAEDACLSTTSIVRGFLESRRMSPCSSSTLRCMWTVEGEARPTAAPISRTEGG